MFWLEVPWLDLVADLHFELGILHFELPIPTLTGDPHFQLAITTRHFAWGLLLFKKVSQN